MYVVDADNNRIKVFTAEVEFPRMFGRYGKERGSWRWPYGVTVDTNDLVYVSDNGMSVFTSEGQFVTSFGKEGWRVRHSFWFGCGQ